MGGEKFYFFISLFGQLFLDVKLIDLFVSASQARSIRINSGLYLPVLGF